MKIFDIVRDHEVLTLDGCILRGDLYRPSTTSPVPCVIYRTPYGKEKLWNEIFGPNDCLEAGFAAYVQDLRGFYRSDGLPNVTNWEQENEDSYATIEALSKEDWCDKQFCLAGSSFPGIVALSSLNKRHPNLKAIAPSMVSLEPFESELTKPLIRFEEIVVWIAHMTVLKARRACGSDIDALNPSVKALGASLMDIRKLFEEIDRTGIPEVLLDLEGETLLRFLDSGTSPFPSLELETLSKIPSIFVTGWYDTFANTTVEIFDAIKTYRGDHESSLFVGPWSHSNQLATNVGQINFGPRGTGAAMGIPNKHAQFLRKLFAGESVKASPVSEFELFNNNWSIEPGSGVRKIALKSVGTAAEIQLMAEATFTPTWGGQTHFTAGEVPGPIDQRPLLHRSDVALLESETFEEDTTVAGEVLVHYEAKDDVSHFVFAKLALVDRWGQILPIQEAVFPAGGLAQGSFPRTRFRVSAGEKLAIIFSLDCYPRYFHPGMLKDRDAVRLRKVDIGGVVDLRLPVV